MEHAAVTSGTSAAPSVDPIVGRRDLPGQRWLPEPDVVHVDQSPPLGQTGSDPITDRRHRQQLGQQDVGELALRADPERQRRPEGDPASVAARRSDHRQSGRLDGPFERVAQLAPAKIGRGGIAREHEAPALPGGRRRRDDGRIGRLRPLGRSCWAAFHVW